MKTKQASENLFRGGEARDPAGRPDIRTSPSPSVYEVSREYLRKETHLHYLAELLLFGVIVALSVWPLFSVADAMSKNLR